MTNEKQELKPCPFCGGKALLNPDKLRGITCENFCVHMPYGHRSTSNHLVKDWNTRTSDIEQLRRAFYSGQTARGVYFYEDRDEDMAQYLNREFDQFLISEHLKEKE